jgi:hypothetical protein
MRFLILFAVLLVTIPVSAQIGDTGGDPGCGIEYPCDSDFPDDQDAGGMKIIKCTNSYGCPMCGIDTVKRTAVCYTLYGQWGLCTCTPTGTYTDKYGILRPRCAGEGSCTAR